MSREGLLKAPKDPGEARRQFTYTGLDVCSIKHLRDAKPSPLAAFRQRRRSKNSDRVVNRLVNLGVMPSRASLQSLGEFCLVLFLL